MYIVNLFSTDSDGVYWSETEMLQNPTEILNNIPYLRPRPHYINLGRAVMTTSYALKLYIANTEFEASTPIMKWLNNMRKGVMAFSSTQVGEHHYKFKMCHSPYKLFWGLWLGMQVLKLAQFNF